MSRARKEKEKEVLQYYRALFRVWGPQHWWPAETRFEVIVGAYLTQNTAWTNVELALVNLRKARVLGVKGIRKVSLRRLERLIRSSGYFRQKAARLKTFVHFLDENYGGSLDRLFAQPTDRLREALLSLNGVGPDRFGSRRVPSTATKPGKTAFTEMFCSLSSAARTPVSMFRAALETE